MKLLHVKFVCVIVCVMLLSVCEVIIVCYCMLSCVCEVCDKVVCVSV